MMIAGWMARKFGPAASTVAVASKPGAILKGVWISAKGTAPSVVVYDAAASVTGADIMPTFVPGTVGAMYSPGEIGCGTGLTFKVASCTGAVIYLPSNSGI